MKRFKKRTRTKKKAPNSVVNSAGWEQSPAMLQYKHFRMPKNKLQLASILYSVRQDNFVRGVRDAEQAAKNAEETKKKERVMLQDVSNADTIKALIKLGECVTQIATDISHALRLNNDVTFGRR